MVINLNEWFYYVSLLHSFKRKDVILLHILLHVLKVLYSNDLKVIIFEIKTEFYFWIKIFRLFVIKKFLVIIFGMM